MQQSHKGQDKFETAILMNISLNVKGKEKNKQRKSHQKKKKPQENHQQFEICTDCFLALSIYT